MPSVALYYSQMLAVSHLITPPFTREVVRAFCETGLPTRFFTTLTPDSPGLAAQLLRALQLGDTRSLPGIPRDSVESYPWREVLRLAMGRVRLGDSWNDRLFHWARDGFDAWVAERMRGTVQLIYAHETECLRTFQEARSRGIRTVYDIPSPEHDHVENLLWREFEKFPELLSPARRRFRTLQAERTTRRHDEFRLADVVVANSNYTRDTWANAGLDGTKIVVIPYGAPAPDPRGIERATIDELPLRLVWAGTFSLRKGAHYLLEAWRQWQPCGNATLDVYGTVSLPTTAISNLPGVTFHGPIPRTKLLESFLTSDALIFPTLCDGFGMVVNEALSRGLPVITTRRAGAADLIQDGRNGRIIEAGNSAAIHDILDWCLTHRRVIRDMRPAALASAEAWQWHDYRTALRRALLGSDGAP